MGFFRKHAPEPDGMESLKPLLFTLPHLLSES